MKINYFRDVNRFLPDFLGIITGIASIALFIFLFHSFLSKEAMDKGDFIQVCISIFILLTLLLGLYVHHQDREKEESAAYLNNSIDLMNKAYDVLKDEGGLTNKRASWETAARLITRSEDIGKMISSIAHRAIYESETEFQKHKFSDLLTFKGKSIHKSFFLGTNKITTSFLGMIHEQQHSIFHKEFGESWISANAIEVLYNFKSYPVKIQTPSESPKNFSETELSTLFMSGEGGAAEYILFRQKFTISKYNIYHNTDKGAEEINAEKLAALFIRYYLTILKRKPK